MIPVLGIPVLNRGDLLLRCIRSIDYPVEKLVIVNNGDDSGVCTVIEQLKRENDFNLLVYKPQHNIGVAASWNWICKHNRPQPDSTGLNIDHYWLLVGSDIQFTAGDLRRIDEFVRAHREYVQCPANWGHSLFAIRQSCYDGAGYFDENFFPAYSEDQDHCYRIKLAGLKWADVPDVHSVHGEPPLWGSSTVWSDPVLNKQSAVTQANNAEYYRRKWGGEPGHETFTRPFGDKELSIKDCPADAELLRANGHPKYS
jgi:GT2 family glycosyltransferase